jgi:hypothetical protein
VLSAPLLGRCTSTVLLTQRDISNKYQRPPQALYARSFTGFSCFFLFIKTFASPSIQSALMEYENKMNSLEISLPLCFIRYQIK